MNNEQPAGLPNPIFQSATEAFLGDSETPIPVRVGQLDEGVPTLTREEFKKASLRQRQLDAEAEAGHKRNETDAHFAITHPKESAKSQAAIAGARPSGKPSRARRTTSPPVFDGTIIPSAQTVDRIAAEQCVLADRIAKMESGQAQLAKGMDKLVELLAARDAKADHFSGQWSPAVETQEESKEVDDAAPLVTEEQAHVFDALEPDEDDVDQEAVEAWEPGDTNLARMQAFIQRRTPLKDFRRFWQALCPRAGYQEWPAEMQTKFTGIFNTIILHPKFLAQVRRTVLTFHNGNCMGEEQQYKALVMLAGCCGLYSIITAEV
jgi:hypothetical protein